MHSGDQVAARDVARPRVNSMTFRASPPTRPENDLPPARPRRTESFMTAQRSRKIRKTRSAGRSALGGFLGEEELVERAARSCGPLPGDRRSCSGFGIGSLLRIR